MKFKTVFTLAVVAAIAGFIEAMYPGSGVVACAMAGAYYANPNIGAGKTPGDHPLNFTVYRVVESGSVPFGHGVKDGTDGETQATLFNSASAVFRGVAMDRIGTVDREKYGAGEGIDIRESGLVTAVVLEAVSPGDPVRIRHTGAGISATASYQEVDIGAGVVGGDATGLDDDTTEYTESIQIGSDTQAVVVVGQDAQTYTTLLAAINVGLAGAQIAINAGNLRITATTTGAGREIDIKAGGTLFEALTAFSSFSDPVDGVDAVEAADTVGAFCKTADLNKTAIISGAEFRSTTTGAGVAEIFLPAGAKKIKADA